MHLRKVTSWPKGLHNERISTGAAPRGGSRPGKHGMRRVASANFPPYASFDRLFRPERLIDAVYDDDQGIIDAAIDANGAQSVRAAIIWRVSKQTMEKLYAAGCSDQDFKHILFSAARFGRLQLLDTLLQCSGLSVQSVQHVGHYRNSLLYVAAQAGHAEVVERLLQLGASAHDGRYMSAFLGYHKFCVSPLEAAVREKHAAVTRHLLEKFPTSTRTLTQLLDVAIAAEDRSCCKVLLEHGAAPGPQAKQQILSLGDALLSLLLRRRDLPCSRR